MIVSPFNPLFFLGNRKISDFDSPFVQLFSKDDRISIQVIRAEGEQPPVCSVCNACDGSTVAIPLCETHVLGNSYADCYTLPVLPCGFYYVSLGENESEPFEITDDEQVLSKTVLIEYSTADNAGRIDVVGIIDGERKYFSFRVPGGFKDEGWEFSVDNEQFVTQYSDIVELYGRESTQKTLTVGPSCGVPVWYGRLLNTLLTCRYVYLDGKRYARFGSSVPEKTQTMPGMNSFVFTQKLQQINYIDPEK